VRPSKLRLGGGLLWGFGNELPEAVHNLFRLPTYDSLRQQAAQGKQIQPSREYPKPRGLFAGGF